MKKLFYIFLLGLFYLPFHQEWIIITSKGKAVFNEAKDYIFELAIMIKEMIVVFYNDIRNS